MNLIAEYKGSAANALFNYQALDDDDDDDDDDYDGSVLGLSVEFFPSLVILPSSREGLLVFAVAGAGALAAGFRC